MTWKFKKFIPQKARGKLTSDIWESDDWIAEEKYDGDRRIAQFCGKVVRFTGTPSRVHGEPVERTENVPHLSGTSMILAINWKAKPKLHPLGMDGTVLDGEMICAPADGVSGEHASTRGGASKFVTAIMGSSPEEAVRKQIERGWLRYVVFDILFYKGKDLRALPMHGPGEHRWTYLHKALMEWGNPFATVAASKGGPFKREFYDKILARGGEGVVLKRIDHKYGEHLKWVKVKGTWTADVVIMGFQAAKEESKKVDGSVSQTKYAKAGLIGAIVCGQYEVPVDERGRVTRINTKPGSTNRVGLVGVATVSGMSDSLRMELSTVGARGYVGLVIEIEHNGREPTGRFRHPRFKRFRPDKQPSECVINMEEV